MIVTAGSIGLIASAAPLFNASIIAAWFYTNRFRFKAVIISRAAAIQARSSALIDFTIGSIMRAFIESRILSNS
jgi:hypothetical protein